MDSKFYTKVGFEPTIHLGLRDIPQPIWNPRCTAAATRVSSTIQLLRSHLTYLLNKNTCFLPLGNNICLNFYNEWIFVKYGEPRKGSSLYLELGLIF